MMSAFEISRIALKQVRTIEGKGTLRSMKWVMIWSEYNIFQKDIMFAPNTTLIANMDTIAPLKVSLDNE